VGFIDATTEYADLSQFRGNLFAPRERCPESQLMMNAISPSPMWVSNGVTDFSYAILIGQPISE
jgi:hypothetical protein